jgi:hypothetical protein
MLIKSTRNWKKYLSPRDEERINAILVDSAKHRSAYRMADDVKPAQLWCAILELKKENAALYKKVRRMESILELVANQLRDETPKQDIIETLEGF